MGSLHHKLSELSPTEVFSLVSLSFSKHNFLFVARVTALEVDVLDVASPLSGYFLFLV